MTTATLYTSRLLVGRMAMRSAWGHRTEAEAWEAAEKAARLSRSRVSITVEAVPADVAARAVPMADGTFRLPA